MAVPAAAQLHWMTVEPARPVAAPSGGDDPRSEPRPGSRRLEPFHGPSEMARLMRGFDWSTTSVGAPEDWSPSLRTAVDIALESRFPIVLWWGPDLVQFNNDAYLPMLGDKHPWSLARPGREVWAEVWETIGPMLGAVMERSESTWSDDLLLNLERRGFPEEGYFTFSYSPIRDTDGSVGGVFCAVTETTARVRGERRLGLLRDLSSDPHRDVHAAAAAVLRKLVAADRDVTFAAIALHRDDEGEPLAAPALGPNHLDAPAIAALAAATDRVGTSGRGEWLTLAGEGPVTVNVLPMPDPGTSACDVLVLGRNPDIADDEDYRSFFELVATHVATELASARAHEAERRRADALVELDRAKTVFFTNVSHEFRTPLTLLDAPLREAIDDPDLPPEHHERIQLARRASGRLRRLVNTLLEFSRIEAGTAKPAIEPIDVVATLDDIVSVFRSAFDRAGLSLEVVDDGTRPVVAADPEMLERILLNLVSNALKFTESGGVRLTARTSGRQAVVEVIDTGVGIAPEDRRRVFDRFARLDAAWSRSSEGSGIGLALAAELARLQRGRLEVDSQIGAGSTFQLTLPLAGARTGGRTRASQDRAVFADEAVGWLHRDDRAAEATVRAEDRIAGTGAARILVVDDNADMNAYLGRVLGRHWEVDLEADGRRALDRILAEPPDLVLADVMMPGIDGLELVRRIRAEPQLATLPVVLLSARAGDEARADALAAGADEYLLKPFTASDLVVRIASRIERDRARRTEADALLASQAELRDLVRRLQTNERELRTALQVKDDFLGMVSHELRTPVTTIRGYAELLLARADDLDASVLHGAIDDIAAEAERLDRVIENLLLLARVGNDRIDAEPVLVGRVIDRVVSGANRQHPDRTIEVATERPLLTKANDGAIEQILKNLVSNAFKYSDPSAPVRVDAASRDGVIEVSVTDLGVGLSAEDREQIFEPFYRAERTKAVAGVGIGLTVARRLAEAVGGSLAAEPRPDGARFTLTLPALVAEDEEH